MRGRSPSCCVAAPGSPGARRLARALLLAALATGVASAAGAISSTVTPQGASYRIDYTLGVPFTLNGIDVTDIRILVAGGAGQVQVDGPYTLSPGSVASFSQTVPFLPTSALIVGLEREQAGVGDEKTHIVMWVDPGFASDALRLRFSQAFPSSRHSLFIANYLEVVAGDAAALQVLLDFFVAGDGASAAFTPGGPFSMVISTTMVACPCYDLADLAQTPLFGTCQALGPWASFTTEYIGWPFFSAQTWQFGCWFSSPFAPDVIRAVTPPEFEACRATALTAAQNAGVSCIQR